MISNSIKLLEDTLKNEEEDVKKWEITLREALPGKSKSSYPIFAKEAYQRWIIEGKKKISDYQKAIKILKKDI